MNGLLGNRGRACGDITVSSPETPKEFVSAAAAGRASVNAGICLEKEAILTADSEVRALDFFSGQGKTHLMTGLMVLCFLFLI